MPTAQPSGGSAQPADDVAIDQLVTGAAEPAPVLTAGSHASHTFTLYAYRGHVYASNVRDKLIDLGVLAREGVGSGEAPEAAESRDPGSGPWHYELDGDHCPRGSGFADAQEALAHLGRALTFLYLDGQFTAQRDLSDVHRPDLPEAPQIVVTLDPRGQADPQVGTAQPR